MCPSFSLCAWRILKIRSCLRRPLAPGRSSWRAILVSSVMFFSFSSEIVIVTYGDLLQRRDVMAGGARGAARLGSAPLGFGCSLRFQNHFFAFCSGNAVQDFVCRVLNTRAGAVKLPRRLRRELAQGVTIAKRMNCFKNQFRPHNVSSCLMNDLN